MLVTRNHSFTRRELAHHVTTWRGTEGVDLFGKEVAVNAVDDLSAILALVKLNGWCTNMLLAPNDDDFVGSVEASKRFISCNFRESDLLSAGDCDFDQVEQPVETQWTIATSGTTGKPKLYTHSISSLLRHVKVDQLRGSQLTWGLLYHPFRFAGIQVALQAIYGGSSLAIASVREDIDRTIGEFAFSQVNAISATPTLWRRILQSSRGRCLRLRQITLGGEIVDQNVLSALRHAYPEARITHIYASTDAGVGFAVTDGKAGFPLEFTHPDALLRSQISVDDQGQLLIRPLSKPLKDLGDEESNTGEWIATGDFVRLYGDRYYFVGRLNGSINVGGNKVMPEEIEQIILAIPGVKEVKVSGRASPITGQIVQANVVPHAVEDANATMKGRILGECRQRLASFKVPGIVKFVTEIELTSTGKVKRTE
jgi:acyl-coenzyme A synthetase/AMP-(fatty) acid ligase